MNNKVIIGVVLVVVLAGGGWYLMSGKDGGASVVDSGNSTMNQLLASKDPVECVYTQDNEQAKTVGTLYVADGKVRGDFNVEAKAVGADGKALTFESHLVTDGKQVLLWPISPEMPNQGVAINVDPNKKDEVNLDQPFDADCKTWAKDDAKFAAPTGVQFADAAQLQQAFQAQAAQQAAAAAASQVKTDTKPVETDPAE